MYMPVWLAVLFGYCNSVWNATVVFWSLFFFLFWKDYEVQYYFRCERERERAKWNPLMLLIIGLGWLEMRSIRLIINTEKEGIFVVVLKSTYRERQDLIYQTTRKMLYYYYYYIIQLKCISNRRMEWNEKWLYKINVHHHHHCRDLSENKLYVFGLSSFVFFRVYRFLIIRTKKLLRSERGEILDSFRTLAMWLRLRLVYHVLWHLNFW